ncbi:hypothetical protein [Halosegnis marinus]|uniref:Uncharacterized protein n=1 Tax=Halosegnis marinus TaxID=3034023 RepID=A0ABD5ZSF9_9EURY|nr:hypothetical protein [Halosegnis sp. DT85]
MRQTDDIDPIVPELPRTRRPVTDGGRRPPRATRPERFDCTPEDEGREAISPLVPDLG